MGNGLMGAIFLSASVPRPDRGTFHEDANPFLIQFAVRELVTLILGRRRLVWGGHPAITPMVWSVCTDIGVDYSNAVRLYQSLFFEDVFPTENAEFKNVFFTPAIDEDRNASLAEMRTQMLSNDFEAGVFIGGMEGVLEEYHLFHERHPEAIVIAVSAPGAAARQLAQQLGQDDERIDFSRLFMDRLKISPAEARKALPPE